MTEIEIADKLYVSFNGWYVKLTCTRDHRVVTIYLNPQACEELTRFIATLRERGTGRPAS